MLVKRDDKISVEWPFSLINELLFLFFLFFKANITTTIIITTNPIEHPTAIPIILILFESSSQEGVKLGDGVIDKEGVDEKEGDCEKVWDELGFNEEEGLVDGVFVAISVTGRPQKSDSIYLSIIILMNFFDGIII